MKNYKIIEDYLDELIPDPKCELNYFNDYSLLIAIMLSAQTTDKRVNEVTKVLFNKYNNLEKLSKANIKDLESIIHPLGNFRKKAYNTKEIARIIHEDYHDTVPNERELLERLPGVGRKTVNVFYAEYLSIPAIAVDTHVERVTKRLSLANKNDDVIKIEKKLMKNIKKENWSKRHLQLVLFGRYYCKAKNPECTNCKLKDICKK
jgi:endonuclease-3